MPRNVYLIAVAEHYDNGRFKIVLSLLKIDNKCVLSQPTYGEENREQESSISILARNLNSGCSYLITAVNNKSVLSQPTLCFCCSNMKKNRRSKSGLLFGDPPAA